jgi:hypothetical protein
MPTLRFKSLIEIRDGNPYVLVSAARARRIKAGWRKPLPVLLQINGQPETPWRINMMPTGSGDFYHPQPPERNPPLFFLAKIASRPHPQR